MRRHFLHLLRLPSLLLIIVLMAACSTPPQQPDQDMLDRRDDAMDELDRNTRRY